MNQNTYIKRLHSIVTIFMTSILAVLLFSCSLHEETAFDRVVSYYHQTGDTLKERAAEYLRDNARWHYGVDRHTSMPIGHQYTYFLSRPETNKDSLFKAYLDSCHIYIVQDEEVMDADTISEEFLRENIDLAFDSWRRPWAEKVAFPDFCKYILPYRNGDEELSDWRNFLKGRYEEGITAPSPTHRTRGPWSTTL